MSKLAGILLYGVVVFLSLPAGAQTALGTITGGVRSNGRPAAGARVFAENEETHSVVSTVTNGSGQYLLQFLPRGRYILRVQSAGYRPVERRDIVLHVAGQVVADVELQALPASVADSLNGLRPELSSGALSLIYDADAQARIGVTDVLPEAIADASSSTVSAVIDEERLRELPLAGRDVYTLFVLLPGVTSDNATSRGLGFSVNGFPVSSSNYLLDGVDNNGVQSTFPATLLSPDGIHEYRLAYTNFSAEYGRGAFVANVVTEQGTNRWHGSAFEYLINEKLTANSFQDNAAGRARPPFKEHQFGYTLGGPLRRDRLFVFTSLEAVQFRTIAATQAVILPAPELLSSASGSFARSLLSRFPPLPLIDAAPLDAGRVQGFMVPPVRIETLSASGRLDWEARPDRDTFFFRFGSFDQAFYNSIKNTFSPYRGLGTPLFTIARGFAAGNVHRFHAGFVNEAKFGFNSETYDFRPRHADVPELASNDRTRLPGSVDTAAEQYYSDRVPHAVENISLLRGRHHLVAGGEYRPDLQSSILAPFRLGHFVYASAAAFAADNPAALLTTTGRFSSTYLAPDYARHYRREEWAAFVQDNWRLSPRLTVNAGLRYDYFGVPRDTGAPDFNFYWGSGATPAERLAGGALLPVTQAPGGGLYRPERTDFAPRVGFAFDALGNSRLIIRGGYGIYYDRVFNQLWDPIRLNALSNVTFNHSQTDFLLAAPASAALSAVPVPRRIQGAYALPSNFSTPYVHSWFVGVERALSRNTLLEINQAGSLGRKLPVQDTVNREQANSGVSQVQLISSDGASDYFAFETSVRRRLAQGIEFEAAHTWSHAIDNQSDALVGPVAGARSFQQEFNYEGDRGNSDFDQRHNLVFHVLWQPPRVNAGRLSRLLNGWQLAGIGAFRTGFPFSVIAGQLGIVPGAGVLLLPRADFTGGDPGPASPVAVAGGKLLLDPAKFSNPAAAPPAHLGNTGRNEFRGPGFWNDDVAVSREIAFRPFAENARLQIRADIFNIFNHANLGTPNAVLDNAGFGVAEFGRKGFQSLALGTSPLNEFPRRVQVALRLMF